LISPSKRFRQRLVEILNKLQNPSSQICLTEKVTSPDQLLHQDTKPVLNLVEPVAILWGEVEHNLMGGVCEEQHPSSYRLENAAFALLPQLDIQSISLSDVGH